MKITEAKYTKRFNDGNYEHTEISLSAQVDGSKEDVAECVGKLKELVYTSRGEEGEDNANISGFDIVGSEDLSREPESGDEAEEQEEIEENPKRSRKSKKVEPEEEEEVAEEESEEAEEEEKPKKKFRSKAAAYDRTNEIHREIFSGIIKEIDPKWNATDAKKARAKKVSQLMNGSDFIDAEGEVLKTFKLETKKALTGK